MKDTTKFSYMPLYSVSDFVDDGYLFYKHGSSNLTSFFPSKNHLRQFFYEGLEDYKLKPYLVILKRISDEEFKYYGNYFKSGALVFKASVCDTKSQKLISNFMFEVKNMDEVFYYLGDDVPEKILLDLKYQIPRVLGEELAKRFKINGNGTNLHLDFINRY